VHFHSPALLAAMRDATVPWQVAHVGPQYVVSLPIIREGQALGVLHIGIDSVFVDRVLLEVMLDVVVVLVVSLFFTLELLNFMAGARLASGLGEFARQVERMRAGDFTATARIRANDEIGRLLRRIDAAVDHLNVRYEFLAGELQDKLRTAVGAESADELEQFRPSVSAVQSDGFMGSVQTCDDCGRCARSDECNEQRGPVIP